MNKIYDFIKKIQIRPLLYIYEPSLLLLKTLLDGYVMCDDDYGSAQSGIFLDGFQRYIEDRYGELKSYGWWQIIETHSTNSQESLTKFFDLIEDYSRGTVSTTPS